MVLCDFLSGQRLGNVFPGPQFRFFWDGARSVSLLPSKRLLRHPTCDLEAFRDLWRLNGLTTPGIINPSAVDQRRHRQRRRLLGLVRSGILYQL